MATPEEIDQLLTRFYDDDIDARWHATEALRYVWDERVVEVLLDRLSDPDPALRAKAAQILERRLDPRILPEMVRLLDDLDSDVQVAAIGCLGAMSDKNAINPLLSCLDDAVPEVRAAAARGLWHFRARRVVAALIDCLQDSAPEVRKAALISLLEQGDQRALAPVIAVMENEAEDDDVREQAIEALSFTAQGHTYNFWDFVYPERDAVEHLLGMIDTLIGTINVETDEIHECNEQLSYSAIRALAKIGDKRAVEPLVALLCDWHGDFGLRLWSLGALGELNDFRVTPILIATLRDPEPMMRPHAAHALSDLCDPLALPELDRLAADEPDKLSEAAAKAAAHIRYEVSWQDFDSLIGYLGSPDDAERRRAIEALSQIDDPRAMEAILNVIPTEHELPDAILVLDDILKIVANAGEARALPLMAAAAEYWAQRKVDTLPRMIDEVADFIRRKLNGEEMGRYISPTDDEYYAIDYDEDDVDDDEND